MATAASSPSPVRPERSGTAGDSAASRYTLSTTAKRLCSAAAGSATPAAAISSSTSASSLGSPSMSHPRKAIEGDRATHTSTDGANSVRRSSYQLHTLAYEGHSAAGDSAAATPHHDSGLPRAAAAVASPLPPSMSLAQYTPTPSQANPPRAPKQALLSYLEQYRTLQPHVRTLYRNRRWRLVFSSDVHGTRMWERCERVFTEEEQRWRHLHTLNAAAAAGEAAAESVARRPPSPGLGEEASAEPPLVVSVPVISLMETDLVVSAPPALREEASPVPTTSAEPAVQIVDSHLCVGLYLHRVPEPGVVCAYSRADVLLFMFETPIQSATSPAAVRTANVQSPGTFPSVSSPSASTAAASHAGHSTPAILMGRLQQSGTMADGAYADLDDAEARASPLRMPLGIADGGGSGAPKHSGSTTPERCNMAATALPSPASPKTHTQRQSPGDAAERGHTAAAAATPSPPPPPMVSATQAAFERTSPVRDGRSPTLAPPSPGGSPHPHHQHHRTPSHELDDATFSSRSARSTSTISRGERRRHASPMTHSASAGYSSPPYVVAAPSSAPPLERGGSPVPATMAARVVAGRQLPRLTLAEEPNRAPLSPLSPLAVVGAATQSPNTITTPRSVSDILTRSADAGAASSLMPVPPMNRRDGGRGAGDARHALPTAGAGGGAQPATFLMTANRTRVPVASAAATRGSAARLSFDTADLVSATTTVVSATSVPGAPWREEEDLTSYWPEAHGTATNTATATAAAPNTGGGATAAGVPALPGVAHAWRRTLSGDDPAAAALTLHHRYISRVSSLIGDETADCYTPRQPRDRSVVHVDPTGANGCADSGGYGSIDPARYTQPGPRHPQHARDDSGDGGSPVPAALSGDGAAADGSGDAGASLPTTAALASSSVRPVSTRVEVFSLLPLDAAVTPSPCASTAAAAAETAAVTVARDAGRAVAGASTPSLGPSTPSSRGHLAGKELGSEDAHDDERQSLSGGGPSRTASELHADDGGAGGSLPLEAEGPLHVFCTTEGDLYVWDPRELQLPPACAAAASDADADDGAASRTLAAVVAQAARCIIRCDGQRLQLNVRHLRCAAAPEGAAGGDAPAATAVGAAAADSELFGFVRAHAMTAAVPGAASGGDSGRGDVVHASLVKMQLCAVSSRPMPCALQRSEVCAEA